MYGSKIDAAVITTLLLIFLLVMASALFESPVQRWDRCIGAGNNIDQCSCIFAHGGHPTERHVERCERRYR